MATTTVHNGTYYRLYKMVSNVWTVIAHGQSVDESIDRDVLDISSQTSGKWTDIMMGRIQSAKYSGSFLLKEDASVDGVSYSDLWTDFIAGNSFRLQLGSGTSGDQHAAPLVYITSLKKTSGDNSPVTFDASFESTGEIPSYTS